MARVTKLVDRGARIAPARTRSAREPKPLWRCRGCGRIFTTWAAAERHAGAPEHRRIDTWLGEEDW